MSEAEAAAAVYAAMTDLERHKRGGRRFWDAVQMERWRCDLSALQATLNEALATWLEIRYRTRGAPLDRAA